ncbi:MAG: permease [Chloroflexota bacterium]
MSDGRGSAQREKARRTILRDWLIFLALVVVAVIFLSRFPEKTEAAKDVGREYLIEMATILPAVMVMMGLFGVFVSRDLVVKYLGKAAGLKGMLIALFLGMLPTGPLYVAFPLALMILKKGARISNVVVFLSAWACIKLPQELIELQFLGFEFMAVRLGLTVVFVILMGLAVEMIIERTDGRWPDVSEGVE